MGSQDMQKLVGTARLEHGADVAYVPVTSVAYSYVKPDQVSHTLRTALGDREVIDKATGNPSKIAKR
ncbi:hypothetical protein CF54_15850 [Streptomyces sp. Tu 6176]|nr:hypothetical protein CF54_15850 [Streptomyces sp. Tu 6176]